MLGILWDVKLLLHLMDAQYVLPCNRPINGHLFPLTSKCDIALGKNFD